MFSDSVHRSARRIGMHWNRLLPEFAEFARRVGQLTDERQGLPGIMVDSLESPDRFRVSYAGMSLLIVLEAAREVGGENAGLVCCYRQSAVDDREFTKVSSFRVSMDGMTSVPADDCDGMMHLAGAAHTLFCLLVKGAPVELESHPAAMP